jgi:hypothetical protein
MPQADRHDEGAADHVGADDGVRERHQLEL